MPVETRVITSSTASSLKTMWVNEREKLCQEAEFASRLVHSWGVIAIPDGETSDGHMAHRLITPDELVERAVLTTQLMFRRCRDLGWTIQTPAIDDLLPEDRKTGF